MKGVVPTLVSAPDSSTGSTRSAKPNTTRVRLICLIRSCCAVGSALKSLIQPLGLPQLNPPSLSLRSTYKDSPMTVLTKRLGTLPEPLMKRLYIKRCKNVRILICGAYTVLLSGTSNLKCPPDTTSMFTFLPFSSVSPIIAE